MVTSLALLKGGIPSSIPPAPQERRPARVVMINLGYPPNTIGGTEMLVQSLARSLVRQGSSVTVVSLSTSGFDQIDHDGGVRAFFIAAHPMGIALLDAARTPLKKLLWHVLGEFNVWTAAKLAPILEQEDPEIIHTHSLLGLSTSVWRLARERGIPIVHTLHDYQLLCPRGTMFRGGQPCPRQCNTCRYLTYRRRRDSALPNAVVGVSENILRTHRVHGYFRDTEPHVIPNGLASSGRGHIGRVHRPDDPWRIGFIGRLHPIKGIELFIDALKELPSNTYVGKIAGSGNVRYTTKLQERAQHHPIEFLGWISPEKFYSQIDLLVVPSLYAEPQGLVLLEAARAGVPVIYSNRGGLSEMGAAFSDFTAFDPASSGNLANALRLYLAGTPRDAAGGFPLPPQFTSEAFLGSYRQLYDRLRVRTMER
jgi:glycosyltransferase involved in cell wall biosynthesis